MTGPRRTRIYQAKDAQLFRLPIAFNAGIQGPDFAPFKVTTPSARIALKLSVLFWQDAGQVTPLYLDPAFGTRMTTGLFLATADKDTTGFYRPTANLIGAIGPNAGSSESLHTYQQLPLDVQNLANTQALHGFSITVQDLQDGLIGTISNQILSAMGAAHHGLNITLRARWEVVGSDMCEEEWSDLRSQMSLLVPDTKVYTV